MAIYTISDLHLSFGVDSKPMDIFGAKWDNYIDKLVNNWNNCVKSTDIVILAGDFSWATYLEDSLEDFKFLDSLPGQKILLKGNHDYWWTTLKKMNGFLETNNITSIKFLYNNAYEMDNYVVAGTRYWSEEEDTNNEKIFNRECERAKISLKSATELNSEKPIIFVTHYPPDERIINCVKDYNIKHWIYGHIHSNYEDSIVKIDNIHTYLTSCDYIDFKPVEIV